MSATRYSGDVTIRITCLDRSSFRSSFDCDTYRAVVSSPAGRTILLEVGAARAPAMASDCSERFDRIAEAALDFASFRTGEESADANVRPHSDHAITDKNSGEAVFFRSRKANQAAMGT